MLRSPDPLRPPVPGTPLTESQALAARAAALAEAREGAAQRVSQGRATLGQEMEAAKTGLQSEVERLAAEVIRTVLKPAA